MKKNIIVAALLMGFAFAAAAQPRAIGARFGFSTEASYQHTVGGENFIEANLGTFGFGGLQASASYNFMILQPEWTSRGEWGVYAGPGLALGTGFSRYYMMNLDIMAQVGLEYTFWFPLQLSVDLRPQIGFVVADANYGYLQKDVKAFYNLTGLYGFIPSISVRYRF